MSKHTELPWTIGEQNGHCGIGINAGNREIATVYLGLITSRVKWGAEHLALPENAEAAANVDFIVRACNNHNGLLEALVELEDCAIGLEADVDSDRDTVINAEATRLACRRARDVIAKANGSQGGALTKL